ncbi:hypothetical protein DFQ27_002164 [Actinomortierella ambigua]|uniref:Actin-like ATPase domain-containing protein n=1 Tax=Actinomortierella ambigua TaxID=1343610 RepID=A0A9P6UCX3_9FUNG|nr:hypothetical protein DFQ27_002164 [Actinomortierella ambigua]
MKSFKSAFIKIGKKDNKTKDAKDRKKEPSTPDPDKVDCNKLSNATTTSLHTIGVSEASSIHMGDSQVAAGLTSSPAIPPVPPVPQVPPVPSMASGSPVGPHETAMSNGAPTAVTATAVAGGADTTATADYAQPHSVHQTTTVVSAASMVDTTPRPPANPQAMMTSPPRSDTADSTEPRSPHTIQNNGLPVVAAAATAPGVDLHRSDTLPPSYNSLHIPTSTSIHAASAPTPGGVATVATMVSAEATPEDVVNTYVAPPPPSTASSPSPLVSSSVGAPTPFLTQQGSPYQHSEHPLPPLPPGAAAANAAHQQLFQNQYHQQQLSSSSSSSPSATAPYPIPGQPLQPSPQQQYVMPHHHVAQAMPMPMSMPMSVPQAVSPSAYGATNYGHRPYVPPGSENTVYPIIMAIDWGTTFSSMAYAYQQDGEVHEVSSWPKQTHNYPKVPTMNLYGPGSKEILEWGYPAKLAITKPHFKNHVLLSKYKLHLDESAGPHPPLPNGLTVVDAIADYLRLFHSHVAQSVLVGFGSSFEQRHIQYCLSVPAMWTDTAKAMMRQAALQAGMISPLDPPHRLLLISEPEAAALYCEKKCDQFSIGHGQRFMICDAGGGTVDLIVFEVVVGPQGRTLREVTRGSGHSCGSVFLDERMEALLRRRFSKWQEKGLSAANWVQLMEAFIQNVKPLFDGIEDQYLTMPAVPGRADLTDYEIGLEDGILTVSAEEMRREVFDPVVEDVLKLIQHQLMQTNNHCHAIFLVGGFGCSGYLYKRVQNEFGSRVPLIAVPPRAELAVVRGAALAGLIPRTVTARVARRWYGVDALMIYEEGWDLPHKRVRDRDGNIRAKDRFSVYVTPGQQIGIDECIRKRYITYQYPNPVNSPLYACSSITLPRYVDEASVEKIGDFLIPLPYVPGALPGHKMVFELRMYFGATEIRAEAEVNGVVVSTRCQFTG